MENLDLLHFLIKSLPADSEHHDILQECLRGLSIGPEPGRLKFFFLGAARTCRKQEPTFSNTFSNFSTEGIAGFEPPPEQQQLEIQAVIGAQAFPGQQQYPVRFEGAVVEAGLPEQPPCPMEGAVGGSCDRAVQFLQTMNQTRDGDGFSELMDDTESRNVEQTVQMI